MPPILGLIAVPFLTAFAAALVLVPICRALAFRVNIVARPKADRWHSRPTALLGGVAIALAVLGCALAFNGFKAQPVLLTCSAIAFLVGLTDDLVGLKPSTKLVAQIALASVFLFFNYRLEWSESISLNGLLTVFWVVGITNAFNLLDNMDGLCGGIALVAGGAFLLNLASLNGPAALGPDATFIAILCGALAGFLVFNVHPASIFMGDSGSLFIGLSLSALALSPEVDEGVRSRLIPIVAAPGLVLLVPIFDTTLVTVSRVLSGRSPSSGGRDHSSHRLVAIGLSERQAVAVLWGLAALAGGVGVAGAHVSESWWALLAVVFLVAMMIFAVYLAHVRVYDEGDARVREGRFTPVVANLFYKRRAAEVLLDLCLVSIAYYGAFRLRFEDPLFKYNFAYFLRSFPVVVGAQMVALYAFGAYRGVWRYFGLMDAVVFAKGVAGGTIGAMLVLLSVYRFQSYSRTVFVMYAAMLLILLTLSRASFRLISEFVQRQRQTGSRLVIYGAGDGGAVTAKELMKDPASGFRMVGFIDDDPNKRRMRVHGYPVLGGYTKLTELVRTRQVDTVVVSTRQLPAARLRELESLCRTHQCGLSSLRLDLMPLVPPQGTLAATPITQARRVQP